VRWAWQNRIPLGAVTLLLGREGEGKGVFSSHLTARATHGQLEGDLHSRSVNVAVISVEDSPERAIVPRLMAAGADLERVRILGVDQDGRPAGMQFP
jgi:archaellum biogenesis ATPase FlaH